MILHVYWIQSVITEIRNKWLIFLPYAPSMPKLPGIAFSGLTFGEININEANEQSFT